VPGWRRHDEGNGWKWEPVPSVPKRDAKKRCLGKGKLLELLEEKGVRREHKEKFEKESQGRELVGALRREKHWAKSQSSRRHDEETRTDGWERAKGQPREKESPSEPQIVLFIPKKVASGRVQR